MLYNTIKVKAALGLGIMWKKGLISLIGLFGMTVLLSSCSFIINPSHTVEITAFSIDNIEGVINGTDITVTMPYGTTDLNLTPTITISEGAMISPASGETQDFTNPVLYTVAAIGSSAKVYTVTVTVAASDTKNIDTFTIPIQVGSTVINEAASPKPTISVMVPFGSVVTGLVATFTTTGHSVAVGSTPQISGVTPNDFTSDVDYIVTAEDATTKEYTVKVRPVVAVGDSYQGGVVAYLLQLGDHGYDASVQHGLIAAASDQSTGAEWGCAGVQMGTGTTIGTGQTNTTAIVSGCSTAGIGAEICDDLVLNGYSDWFLPSKDELSQLYTNRVLIGGFASLKYWSSSEYDATYVWDQNFNNGIKNYLNTKASPHYVRCIRAF